MRVMKYHIPIRPIAWKRAGVRFQTQSFFDTQKAEKIAIGCHISRQHGNEALFKVAAIHINFLFKETKKQKASPHYPWHAQTPDVDNLLKLIFDVLTGICFIDDSVIAKISSEKRWDKNNAIEITITELSGE